jgi:hypothetical protein
MTMNTDTTLFAFVGLLLLNPVADAAVYKTVDANGNVSYTDEPVGDQQPVALPPLSTVPPPRYNTVTKPADTHPDNELTAAYQKIVLAAPAPEETVRDNTGNVTVSALTEPVLDTTAGHRLQFFLDGQSEGKPTTSGRSLYQNLDRGTHTAEVAVVDASGRELGRSDSVRFYVHRQSINFPRGPVAPAPR